MSESDQGIPPCSSSSDDGEQKPKPKIPQIQTRQTRSSARHRKSGQQSSTKPDDQIVEKAMLIKEKKKSNANKSSIKKAQEDIVMQETTKQILDEVNQEDDSQVQESSQLSNIPMRTFKSQDKPKKQLPKVKEDKEEQPQIKDKSRSREVSQESSNYRIKPKQAKASTPQNTKKEKKAVPRVKAQNKEILSNAQQLILEGLKEYAYDLIGDKRTGPKSKRVITTISLRKALNDQEISLGNNSEMQRKVLKQMMYYATGKQAEDDEGLAEKELRALSEIDRNKYFIRRNEKYDRYNAVNDQIDFQNFSKVFNDGRFKVDSEGKIL